MSLQALQILSALLNRTLPTAVGSYPKVVESVLGRKAPLFKKSEKAANSLI